MICEHCKKDFSGIKAEQGITYEGIDYHHNPPEFMVDKWKGELLKLCRKCHKELHIKIREIMFKHSTLFKPNKSDYWTWIKVLPCDREKCVNEVIKYTKELVNDKSS